MGLPMRWSSAFLLAGLLAAAGVVTAKEPSFRPLRLADGRPDLQGNWLHSNGTPFVRPDGIATLIISPAQAAAIDKRIQDEFDDRSVPNDATTDFVKRPIEPIRGQLRSSIIVDPSDGKLPGTPLFNEWRAKLQFSVINATDGPEQRPTSERCLGNPASQAPILYNPGTNLHQIVQTQDTIVFFSEVMHEARVIRLNAKHSPAAITSWAGDSIGWWDGDTLVVETKFFTPSDTGRNAARYIGYRLSPQATVTERFTRVSADQLDYAFTVEDSINYTRSWSGETHFRRSDDQLFEYSCHEGNYALANILQAARVHDVK